MGHLFIREPHTIVILRALQLGDLLCTVPAFRALRASFPEARITLVGLPWAEDFVRRFSHYLDEFIEFPGWPGLPEQKPHIELIPAFLSTMQKRRFDLALQMQGSGLLTNALIDLFGARQTAGYYLPGQFQPNQRTFPQYPAEQHEIRVFLQLMESLGISTQGEALEFPVSEEERREFQSFCSTFGLESGRYVCLHPGARFPGRRISPAQFAAVGDALVRQGYRVVLTGTAADRELTGAVDAHMQSSGLAGQSILDAAGLTSLGVLALLLDHSALLVSNDTGVSHIAAALQTPSVIFFTASDPARWRPLNHHLHKIIPNAGQASLAEILAAVSALLSTPKALPKESLTGT
jgi:ADP-heptose:LPS heptosyltransferase